MALLAITAIVAVNWVLSGSLVLIGHDYKLVFTSDCHRLSAEQERLKIFGVHRECTKHRMMLLHHGQDHSDSSFHHSQRVLNDYNTCKTM